MDNMKMGDFISELRKSSRMTQKQLAEVVVLVLDAVDERDLDLFAHKVLNLWGVGEKGRDNGLVISVVRQQRDIQFETGMPSSCPSPSMTSA